MKRKIAAIVGLALLCALSASAQDMKTNLMKVPFAFMAGDKALPAGEYRVQANLSTGVVLLLSPAGAGASMLTMADDYREKQDGQDTLEFRRVGNAWFLQQVTVSGYARSLFPSKFEQRELAKLNPPGRQTLVASSVPAR